MEKKSSHIIGLDVFRGVAIVLMFITHCFKLQLSHDPHFGMHLTLADKMLWSFLQIEPFTSASFLFLAGISTVLAYEANPNNWLKKVFTRAGVIYLISVFLSFLEDGITGISNFLSPNILLPIAISYIVIALCLWAFKKSSIPSLLLIVTSLFSIQFLESNQLQLMTINAGPGACLPMIHFAFWGYLIGTCYKQENFKWIAYPFPLVLIFAYFGYISHSSWIWEYKFLDKEYWNHSLVGTLRLVPILVFATIQCLRVKTPNLIQLGLASLGNYSLTLYVSHLIFIRVIDLTGLAPLSGGTTWALVGSIVFGSFLYTTYRNNKKSVITLQK